MSDPQTVRQWFRALRAQAWTAGVPPIRIYFMSDNPKYGPFSDGFSLDHPSDYQRLVNGEVSFHGLSRIEEAMHARMEEIKGSIFRKGSLD